MSHRFSPVRYLLILGQIQNLPFRTCSTNKHIIGRISKQLKSVGEKQRTMVDFIEFCDSNTATMMRIQYSLGADMLKHFILHIHFDIQS